MYLRELYVWTKSHAHENLRALGSHSRAISREQKSYYAIDGPSSLV